jgi:hypothetical protein
VDHPYNFVKASMVSFDFNGSPFDFLIPDLSLFSTQKTGSYVPSFCSVLLEDKEKCNTQFEFDLKWTANSMYSASMDTVCRLS